MHGIGAADAVDQGQQSRIDLIFLSSGRFFAASASESARYTRNGSRYAAHGVGKTPASASAPATGFAGTTTTSTAVTARTSTLRRGVLSSRGRLRSACLPCLPRFGDSTFRPVLSSRGGLSFYSTGTSSRPPTCACTATSTYQCHCILPPLNFAKKSFADIGGAEKTVLVNTSLPEVTILISRSRKRKDRAVRGAKFQHPSFDSIYW